jgi:GT2 family glycosyltransferase
MKLGIGIPTINRYDLLYPSLIIYKNDFSKNNIYVVDNGNQNIDISGINVYNQSKNLGVAGSWNFLLNIIFQNNDFALILNDDIYLGKRFIEIKGFVSNKKLNDSLITSTNDWCAFLIPKKIFEKVGQFDEVFFPAYYEDKSYEYRMKLLGMKAVRSPFLNPMIYKSSQTMVKMPSLQESSKKNKIKYIEMWGGEPGLEKYKKPFNGHIAQ